MDFIREDLFLNVVIVHSLRVTGVISGADNEDSLEPWPQRLTVPSPRLQELGIADRSYETDTVSSVSSFLMQSSQYRLSYHDVGV